MQNGKRISPKIKRKAVEEYRLKGNAAAIARKYGVTRSTFLRWLSPVENTVDVADPIISSACVKAINRAADATIREIHASAATRNEFLRIHYAQVNELFSSILARMTATLNDENSRPSLRDQAAALTALSNFMKEFTSTEEQGPTTINLLQQTVNS